MEYEYGRHLAEVIDREWTISNLQEIIDDWEKEHSSSLALLFENETQKLMLEKLNKKLTNAADIMERDMKMAENVQKSILFQTPPRTTNYDIAFHYQPYASVAGDFYDFYVDKDENLAGLVLADVSGHGIASSLLTALTKPIFYRTFRDNPSLSLSNVLKKINHRLIEQMTESENYLTAVLLRFNGDNVEYVNAAHPDIMLLDSSAKACRPVKLDKETIQGHVLGLEIVSSSTSFEICKFAIKSGDALVIYTDCLNESLNREGDAFGEGNIIGTLSGISEGSSAKEILQGITSAFNNYTENKPLNDDLTILVIKKK